MAWSKLDIIIVSEISQACKASITVKFICGIPDSESPAVSSRMMGPRMFNVREATGKGASMALTLPLNRSKGFIV